jgi:hypothetical protein
VAATDGGEILEPARPARCLTTTPTPPTPGLAEGGRDVFVVGLAVEIEFSAVVVEPAEG